MENFRVIELHQARDFSRKMNATFEFVRQNFKSLTKSILFIAGPPILVGSMLLGSFFGEFMSQAQNVSRYPGSPELFNNYFFSVSFWLQMILLVVFMTISTVVTIATINNYIILYGEKRTNKIEVHEVWVRVRSTFWLYFGTLFLFGILGMVAYLVMLIPMFILSAISPFLIFFGFLFVFGGLIYFLFSMSLVFFIRGYEGIGFFSAVGRSYALVRGKWWSTFGLIIILYLIVMIISYIPIIPWYIMLFVNSLHSVKTGTYENPMESMQIFTTIFFALYYLVNMILVSLPNVGIAFQYFNLVELKEAKGLMNQIETLGQEPTVKAQDEHEHF